LRKPAAVDPAAWRPVMKMGARVCVIACLPDDDPLRARPKEEVCCPCNIWLDAPLGERTVINVDTGRELTLYIPRWGTDEPSLYVPRPGGTLWPPEEMNAIEESLSNPDP
jgi:hypothetical protein